MIHDTAICKTQLPKEITIQTEGIEFAGIPLVTAQFCSDFW